MDGGRYVAAVIRQVGRPAIDVLGEALPGLIASLRFDKSMRWNSSNVYFSRPIRWLLALFGKQVIPFEFAGVHSGKHTRGLRIRTPAEFQVKNATDYFYLMEDQGIILEKAERISIIQAQLDHLVHDVSGRILSDPALLSEVANLVEAPTSVIGSFDPAHLNLPREVLISVMKKHQRYFPVFKIASPSAGETHYSPQLTWE